MKWWQEEYLEFRKTVPSLVQAGLEGKYALLHNSEASFFGTYEEALQAGYDEYGLDEFLVQQVLEHEKPVWFSRGAVRVEQV